MVVVSPCQAANKTIGQGGFQEVEQMAMFKDSVCYQEEAHGMAGIPLGFIGPVVNPRSFFFLQPNGEIEVSVGE